VRSYVSGKSTTALAWLCARYISTLVVYPTLYTYKEEHMQAITERISVWHLKQAYHAELKNVLGNVEIVKRLDRAYEMLTRDERYSIAVASKSPLTFSVVSPNDTYSVIESQRLCTCPDGTVLCKHRLAVRLILSTIRLMQAEGVELCKS